MCETQADWIFFWQLLRPQSQHAPQEGMGIDIGLNAVTTMAPAAYMDDSCFQTILKSLCPNSFDYISFHGVPVVNGIFWILDFAEWLPFTMSTNGLYGCCKKRRATTERPEHNGLLPKAQIRDSFLMLLASTDTNVVVVVIISDERGYCWTNEAGLHTDQNWNVSHEKLFYKLIFLFIFCETLSF